MLKTAVISESVSRGRFAPIVHQVLHSHDDAAMKQYIVYTVQSTIHDSSSLFIFPLLHLVSFFASFPLIVS